MGTVADSRFLFPWREGNRVTLLIDGGQFFPAMLAAVAQSRNTVLMEMYLLESGRVMDRFIEAFIGAAERGVRVSLLLDAFGCRGLSKTDRERLVHPNIVTVYYNPLSYGEFRRNLFRDHRKLLVIDGEVAFIGGAGLTDSFDILNGRASWRETMLQIQGACVHDWVQLFARTWRQVSSVPISLPACVMQQFEDGIPGRVACSRGHHMQEIKRSLIKRVRSAEREIWIATAYFVPSIKIRRALGRAAQRGVDVRLLLPGEFTDHPAVRHAGRRFYYSLLRAGVRVFEYQPRFTHAKVMICDAWVSIGSSNIDRWNLRWNLEANQELEDQAFAHRVREMFETDFAQCVEHTLENWRCRPWHRRLLEWFWGRIDVLLDRFSRRRRWWKKLP